MNIDIHNSTLGKQASYPEKYDASLLFRIPRSENRKLYGIEAEHLPFKGVDVWNCFELSFLTDNGFPVSKLMKLIYPADSKFLVESKSLKLYLNSFNMEHFGNTDESATENVISIIKRDLSNLLETDVAIALFSKEYATKVPFADIQNIILSEMIPSDRLSAANFNNFIENPKLLKSELTENMHQYAFSTDILRSNCPVTHQPDWGDLFVRMETNHLVELVSIVAYLISFRKENHFHEEVVEMIYRRFLDAFEPQKLMVAAMYTRRGGIDINPIRASHTELLDEAFISTQYALAKSWRQ